jgi:hypothetical protein
VSTINLSGLIQVYQWMCTIFIFFNPSTGSLAQNRKFKVEGKHSQIHNTEKYRTSSSSIKINYKKFKYDNYLHCICIWMWVCVSDAQCECMLLALWNFPVHIKMTIAFAYLLLNVKKLNILVLMRYQLLKRKWKCMWSIIHSELPYCLLQWSPYQCRISRCTLCRRQVLGDTTRLLVIKNSHGFAR